MAFSPDGTKLAAGAMDGTVAVFDTATGRQVGERYAKRRNCLCSGRLCATPMHAWLCGTSRCVGARDQKLRANMCFGGQYA